MIFASQKCFRITREKANWLRFSSDKTRYIPWMVIQLTTKATCATEEPGIKLGGTRKVRVPQLFHSCNFFANLVTVFTF